MKFWKKNKWFTFVEILWVLMIIAILLSISVVSFRHSQAKARDVIRKSDLQMIADALISYGNDHWHFPSSIYDNWQALTISQALNSIVNWWIYQPSWRQMKYYPNTNLIQNILWLTDEELQNYLDKYFDQTYVESVWEWLGVTDWDSIYTLKESINDEDFEGIASIIDINESEVPLHTNLKSIQRNMNYTIITQGMCASSLRKYLIDEWYISTIPEDPSWQSVNLQTNIISVIENTLPLSRIWKMKIDETMKLQLVDHVKLNENVVVDETKHHGPRQTNFLVTSLMNLKTHLTVSKKTE